MKVFHCKWPNKYDSKNNEFEYRCGTDVFETYYKDWDPDFKNYLNHINEINDPILKHISIYFVQHYINGYRYYHESGSNHRNTACQYLKHWLQEKKDLFTYGETCQTKIDLWDKVIGNLWNVLKNQYTVQDFYGKNPWCKKTPLSEKTEYPRELPPFNCEESLAQEPSSADPSSKSVPTECNCQNVDPVLTPPLDQAPEKDLTKNIAVTSVYPNDVLVQKTRYA
ncbi:hypothetical protein PVBG_06343 [Plasmodium vivax Brazil I]|uniref:Uncharacterized protein n=1 Tax=Plasmodium vivax (strain Brazil I) TaxID=1033975 RepID=A0A0J9SKI5_PLAV1|nr:hypothetical protein PVBG_06343 [Plasmodium vivax Brazil I]